MIVGGKSSGKSLLLYHIAKTIDPDQVDKKMSVLGIRQYDFEQKEDFNFKVIWGDGVRMHLRDNDEIKSVYHLYSADVHQSSS